MDLTDIQYLIELLESSIYNQDWDSVQEAIEILKESVSEESIDSENE